MCTRRHEIGKEVKTYTQAENNPKLRARFKKLWCSQVTQD